MPFPPRSTLSWKLLSRVGQAQALAERGFMPPLPEDIGHDVSIVAWCNGVSIVEPHALVFTDDVATLVVPTSDAIVAHTIAAFHDDMVLHKHRGPLVLRVRITPSGDVGAHSISTLPPRPVARAWSALLNDPDQLTDFYAGSLEQWELVPDWPMALVTRDGRMSIGHVLTFMREDVGTPLALLDAEDTLDTLRTLGWMGREPQSLTDFVAERASLELRNPPTTPSQPTQGEHTQTGGFENPRTAVDVTPISPASAGGSSSPSPSN